MKELITECYELFSKRIQEQKQINSNQSFKSNRVINKKDKKEE